MPQYYRINPNDLPFINPIAAYSENFEYSENWSGTISDINYTNSTIFDISPILVQNESFETSEGWS